MFICAALLSVLVGVLGAVEFFVGSRPVGLVLLLIAVFGCWFDFATYYAAELGPDGALHFRSLLRETDTNVRLLTGITAYRGGNDRYQFFKIRDEHATFRIRGKRAGAFVDEIIAAAPDVQVQRKLLRGA